MFEIRRRYPLLRRALKADRLEERSIDSPVTLDGPATMKGMCLPFTSRTVDRRVELILPMASKIILVALSRETR